MTASPQDRAERAEAERAVADHIAAELEARGVEHRLGTWGRPYAPVESYGLELPVAVLGVVDGHTLSRGRYGGGRPWFAIGHQHAGILCAQLHIVATPLTIRPSAWEGVAKLGRRWYGSSVGRFSPSLTLLNEYRDSVRQLLHADCDQSYEVFGEAVYPIDLDYLSTITTETTIRPHDLIDWDPDYKIPLMPIGSWKLLILDTNSD